MSHFLLRGPCFSLAALCFTAQLCVAINPVWGLTAVITLILSVGCGIYDRSMELWSASVGHASPCGWIWAGDDYLIAAGRSSSWKLPSWWEGLIVPLLPPQPHELLHGQGGKPTARNPK